MFQRSKFGSHGSHAQSRANKGFATLLELIHPLFYKCSIFVLPVCYWLQTSENKFLLIPLKPNFFPTHRSGGNVVPLSFIYLKSFSPKSSPILLMSIDVPFGYRKQKAILPKFLYLSQNGFKSIWAHISSRAFDCLSQLGKRGNPAKRFHVGPHHLYCWLCWWRCV